MIIFFIFQEKNNIENEDESTTNETNVESTPMSSPEMSQFDESKLTDDVNELSTNSKVQNNCEMNANRKNVKSNNNNNNNIVTNNCKSNNNEDENDGECCTNKEETDNFELIDFEENTEESNISEEPEVSDKENA